MEGRISMDSIFLYAIIIQEKDNRWTYESPQFSSIHGEASTVEAVYTEAKEALEQLIYERIINQEAIHPQPVDWEAKQSVLIGLSTNEVIRKYGTKPVKKMVSLPSWLSYQADKEGLSLSKVLQAALKEKLKRKDG